MNWKTWGAAVVLVVALAYGVRQFRVGWRERPPANFQFKEHRSPSLDSAMRARLREWNREPVASLTIWQIGAAKPRDRVWTLETLYNRGLNPLQRIERSSHTNVAVTGFYTAAGEPLAFIEKRDPANAARVLFTLHLPAPLAPGATQQVIRVEERAHRLTPDSNGNFVARADRINPRQIGWHIRAIELPATAQLVQVTPTGVAGPFFVWSAWEHETKPPLTIQYRLR